MARMSKEAAEQIVTNGDYSDEVRTYEGYSGRGMYGSETTGIVVYYRNDVDEVISQARQRGISLRQDSLGLNTILY